MQTDLSDVYCVQEDTQQHLSVIYDFMNQLSNLIVLLYYFFKVTSPCNTAYMGALHHAWILWKMIYKEGIALYKSLSEPWKKTSMHTHKCMVISLSCSVEEAPDICKCFNSVPLQDRTCKLELSESNLPSMKTLEVMQRANENVFTFSSKLSDHESKQTK